MKLSRRFDATVWASKTILCKKSAKCELDAVTKKIKEWNTELKLLRGYLQKLDLHIDDSKMMPQIL